MIEFYNCFDVKGLKVEKAVFCTYTLNLNLAGSFEMIKGIRRYLSFNSLDIPRSNIEIHKITSYEIDVCIFIPNNFDLSYEDKIEEFIDVFGRNYLD